MHRFWLSSLLTGVAILAAVPSESFSAENTFLTFIRSQAATLRAGHPSPKTAEEWQQQRIRLREQLEEAWGGFPAEPCPLEPRVLATFERDGYRVEKLLLQTMPGVWMTALAYVPAAPGPHPAILNVHGHWKHAKVEPLIQSRCIGAAKLGYFVLAVDAFGAGERGLGEALGEYHGEMVAATLFPIGRPLSGIQVYENMRAVDYLQSRPEVDPQRIGITGASGGGNQSMYAGAWDERIGAVVPVCSVGNYQAYLGAACCMCEVVPGALTFTEEAGILSLTAPRALMPCNVTRDSVPFAIREARKSIVGAQQVYDLLGQPDRLYHTTFRWTHDYHQPIREAMYGWMTQNLKGEGDGSPIAEPAHQTEPTEELRCFPGDSRPDDWLTLPRFAAREGRLLTESLSWPQTGQNGPQLDAVRKTLVEKVLGGFPAAVPLEITATPASSEEGERLSFVSEPGITLELQQIPTTASPKTGEVTDVFLVISLEGAATARKSPVVSALLEQGKQVVTLDLRATGTLAYGADAVGRAPDHNTAEWSLWIGRPLLGQWTWDVLRAVDVLKSTASKETTARFHLVGLGPAGLVALTAGASSPVFQSVAVSGTLGSFITETPYVGQRLGTIAPGILRDVGDVSHLVALSQSPRVVLAGMVAGDGTEMPVAVLQPQLDRAVSLAGKQPGKSGVTLLGATGAGEVMNALLQP